MPKAISYVRFSTAEQASGSSEERQLQRYRQWLDRNPEYEESNLSEVDRGASAYKSKHLNAGLGKLLDAIEDKRIFKGDVIVIEAFDRLSREETTVALDRITRILNSGVKIVTLEDGQTYEKNSLNTSAIYVLVSKIQASHEYSKRLSTRVKAGWRRNYDRLNKGEKAKAPNRPKWIDANGKLIEERAQVVRDGIILYRNGEGVREIIKKLSTKYGELAPNADTTVRNWLRNPSLAGYWNGVKAFDGVITLEEHYELQEMVKTRAKYGKPEEPYLLSGLIKCPECGGSFNFRRQNPRPTKREPLGSVEYANKPAIVYANCGNYLKLGTCVNGFTVPYEIAHYVLSESVGELLVSIAESKAIDALDRKQYAGMKEKMAMIERDYTAAKKLYKKTTDDEDLIEVEILKAKKDELEAKILHHEQRLSLLNAAKQELTLEEFEQGTEEQRALNLEIHKIMHEIEASTLEFRNALKQNGYRIEASKVEGVGLLTNSETLDQFRLIRRKQKLGAYEVEVCRYDKDDGSLLQTELVLVRR